MSKFKELTVTGIILAFMAVGTFMTARGLIQAVLYHGMQVTTRSGSLFIRLSEYPFSFYFYVVLYSFLLLTLLRVWLFVFTSVSRKLRRSNP